jgi:hypothetical protein
VGMLRHLQRILRLLVLGTKATAEDASNEAVVMTIHFIFEGEERRGVVVVIWMCLFLLLAAAVATDRSMDFEKKEERKRSLL